MRDEGGGGGGSEFSWLRVLFLGPWHKPGTGVFKSCISVFSGVFWLSIGVLLDKERFSGQPP
jgi:hypothetical protein